MSYREKEDTFLKVNKGLIDCFSQYTMGAWENSLKKKPWNCMELKEILIAM